MEIIVNQFLLETINSWIIDYTMEMSKLIVESEINENEFLICLEDTLKSVEKNLRKFVIAAPKIIADSELETGLQTIKTEGQKIHQLLSSVVQPFLSSRKNQSEVPEPKLRHKYEQLKEQLHDQTIKLERSIEESQSLKTQILNQSTFCASLGAVLGNLAWRASCFPEIVDIWLSSLQSKVKEFLSIVNGSFLAFISTYETGIPPTNNVEYQYILGLLGIITNISSVSKGREFIITNQNGKDLVEKIIKFMPNFFPVTSGTHSLIRLMLMILYNVSMNNNGLCCLFEFRVVDVLSHCLEKDTLVEELQLLCLRILQSISYDLKDPKYIEDLTTSIPIRNIKIIASKGQSETSCVAKKIIKQLEKALNSRENQ